MVACRLAFPFWLDCRGAETRRDGTPANAAIDRPDRASHPRYPSCHPPSPLTISPIAVGK